MTTFAALAGVIRDWFARVLTKLSKVETQLEEVRLLLKPSPATSLDFTYKGGVQMPYQFDAAGSPILVTLEADNLRQKHGGAELDSAPVWSIDDATTATLTPAADGMSAVLALVEGGTGSQVTITATSVSGNGANQLTHSDVVTIPAGPATSLDFSFGPVPAPPSA